MDDTNHSPPEPEPSGQPPRKRRRPALACTRCRSRKVKCDRNLPCNQCIRMNSAPLCEYTPDDRIPDRHGKAREITRPHVLTPSTNASSTEEAAGTNANELAYRASAIRRQGINQFPYAFKDTHAGTIDYRRHYQHSPSPTQATRGPLRETSSPSDARNSTSNDRSVAPDTPGFSRFVIGTHKSAEALGSRAQFNVQEALKRLQQVSNTSKELLQNHDDDRLDGETSSSAARNLVEGLKDLETSLSRISDLQEQERSKGLPEKFHTDRLPAGWTFEKTRLWAQGHWRSCLSQFRLILRLYYRAERQPDSELPRLLHECKQLGKEIKRHPVLKTMSTAELAASLPAKEIVDRLVEAYLQTFEYVFRILHVPTFRLELSRFWQNPGATTTSFMMRLLVIMSIGSCFVEISDTPQASRAIVTEWIHRVTFWLSAPSEKPRTNIAGLQTHCLLLLARQAAGVGGDVVWLSAGTLLRTAIHMGLHRDPSHIPSLTIFQCEIRRRLWATVLEISIQATMDSAGPPLLSLHDFDTLPPSNINDIDLSQDLTELPVSQPIEQYTQSTLQVLLMRSLPVRLEIATKLADFRADLPYQHALRLAADLSTLCRTHHTLFKKYARGLSPSQPRPMHIQLFDIHTHRFLMALHAPFALRAIDNENLYYSHKACVDCAVYLAGDDDDEPTSTTTIPNIASTSTNSPAAKDDPYPFLRLRLLGSGLYRDIYILCYLFLSLDILHSLDDSPTSVASISSSTQAPTRRRLYRMIVANATHLLERLRLAETNVKGYLQWCCIRAQIDGLEAGEEQAEIEERVMKAAAGALGTARGVLRGRLEEGDRVMGRGGEGREMQEDEMWGGDDAVYNMVSTFNFNIPDSWLFPSETIGDGSMYALM